MTANYRLYFFGFFLFLPFSWILAQNIAQNDGATLEWGKPYKEFPGGILADYIGVMDGKYFILKGETGNNYEPTLTNRFLIDGFDQDLNRVHKVRTKVVVDNKTLDPEFVLAQSGKLQMYSSLKNYRANKSTLYRHELHLPTGEPRYPGEIIGSTPITSGSRANNFSFHYSRDSSHVLIYGNARNRRNDPEQFAFIVQDELGDEVWSRIVTLPYAENLFEVENVKISSKGTVFLLGRLYQERVQEKRKGKPNYIYHVLAYEDGDSEPREYVVNVRQKFLTDMQVDISTNGDPICVGFYSEKGTYSILGSFYLKVNAETGEISQSNFQEFGTGIYTQNSTAKEAERVEKAAASGRKRELYEYQLAELVPRGDGGAVAIAEQFYTRTITSAGAGGRPIPQSEYNYHSLIVVSISPKGEIEWMAKVPKKQSSLGDPGYYSSFQHMITPEKMYFIYNDDVRNLEQTQWRKFKNYAPATRRGIVCIASVDAEGNVERKSLMRRDEMETKMVPKVGEQISPNEAILFGKRWKDTQVGRLRFD